MPAQNLIELFQKLQPLVDQTGDYDLQSQLMQLRETYSSMLRYMVQGMDDPNASRIYVRGVNVRVSPDLVKDINLLCCGRFRRETGGAVAIRQPRGTREQRIEQTLAFIREQGYMRLADYARLMQISHSTASRELKSFCQDPDVPIRASGRGPSRLFVESKVKQ
jgi:hypothetical protein